MVHANLQKAQMQKVTYITQHMIEIVIKERRNDASCVCIYAYALYIQC